ncbi:MAG: glycine betaine ABC transporter substrate-binding protein [Mobilicoccus sp.]|nr:glycine betaine ABC transporter substrate-binding protein [Mobilicoccus sp.]
MRALRVAAVAATASLTLSGCALFADSPQQAYGGAATDGPLAGVSVAVGGKNFTEQLVLCEIIAQRLEALSAAVQRTCGIAGSATVRQALTSGNIDVYYEYTGTGWITFLQETEPIPDPVEQFEAVRERDADNGVTWLDPAPANNTYAVAAASDYAAEKGISTLSEYAELVASDPAAASYCGGSEFLGRDDGWAGVQQAYGFSLPAAQTNTLDEGAIYQAVANGSPCRFGTVFATDGRIKGLGLTVLEDDQNFFPFYNVALNVRTPVLEEHPQIGSVMAPVSALLTDEVLQELNARVDVEGEQPEQVARDWLRKYGLA